MKSVWHKNLIICGVLGLLAIPIYFLDRALLGGGGGSGWITLDFQGLIFWTYITLLAIHVALSSVAVLLFPKTGVLRIHLGSMVLSVVPSTGDIATVFMKSPQQDDDGEYFYGVLPPPFSTTRLNRAPPADE